jgi:hypothetical protein
MNEQTKKNQSTEREAKVTELSEQDLEQAAGGGDAQTAPGEKIKPTGTATGS